MARGKAAPAWSVAVGPTAGLLSAIDVHLNRSIPVLHLPGPRRPIPGRCSTLTRCSPLLKRRHKVSAYGRPASPHSTTTDCQARTPASRAGCGTWSNRRPSAGPTRGGGMNIEFLFDVAVIAPDPPASRELYVDALGLPLESQGGEYHHSEQIAGCRSFGSGRWRRPPRHASGRRSGRRNGRCRRSASSSTSRTPRRWARDTGTRARWLRAAAPTPRGAVGQTWPGYSRRRARLSGSRTPRPAQRRLTR